MIVLDLLSNVSGLFVVLSCVKSTLPPFYPLRIVVAAFFFLGEEWEQFCLTLLHFDCFCFLHIWSAVSLLSQLKMIDYAYRKRIIIRLSTYLNKTVHCSYLLACLFKESLVFTYHHCCKFAVFHLVQCCYALP